MNPVEARPKTQVVHILLVMPTAFDKRTQKEEIKYVFEKEIGLSVPTEQSHGASLEEMSLSKL